MSPFLSRLAVVAAGLPIVLGSAYLGGWFLLALTAVAGLVALHEFYRLARQLRPLVLAGYGGALGALFGAQLGGLDAVRGTVNELGGTDPDPRFTLANERTFLAWVRTALAVVAGLAAWVVHSILARTPRGRVATPGAWRHHGRKVRGGQEVAMFGREGRKECDAALHAWLGSETPSNGSRVPSASARRVRPEK
jgi:hypothetical protein